jgi:hypothetical protein
VRTYVSSIQASARAFLSTAQAETGHGLSSRLKGLRGQASARQTGGLAPKVRGRNGSGARTRAPELSLTRRASEHACRQSKFVQGQCIENRGNMSRCYGFYVSCLFGASMSVLVRVVGALRVPTCLVERARSLPKLQPLQPLRAARGAPCGSAPCRTALRCAALRYIASSLATPRHALLTRTRACGSLRRGGRRPSRGRRRP